MDVRFYGLKTKKMNILEEQKSEETELVPLLQRLEPRYGADGSELHDNDEV